MSSRRIPSDSPRIAVVFTQPHRLSKGDEMDIRSEDGVGDAAECVAGALRDEGLQARSMEMGEDVASLIQRLSEWDTDVVFNLAETVQGESSLESFVPNLLDFLGFPYTGSDPAAINLCLDKARTKEALRAHGIPTPAYQVMENSSLDSFALPFPVVVKPLREDGSLGIHEHSVVKKDVQLRKQVEYILSNYRQPALVESYAGDREFNVSLLGNAPPLILPPCEIDYSKMPEGLPKIVGFKAKWFPASPEYRGSLPVCPAPISGKLLEQVEQTAVAAFRACGVRDYGRVDLRWDGENAPAVIDVNPNPAITQDSGFVISAHQGGIPYADLVEKIVRFALARKDASRRADGLLPSHN